MSYTTLENTPIDIDLKIQGNSNGWKLSGSIATHEVCNAGVMILKDYVLNTGEEIQFSYRINSISSGIIRPQLGSVLGTSRSTPQFITENMIATADNSVFSFYSNADCEIELFDLKKVTVDISLKQINTLGWSEPNNKWGSFYTYNPDCAFSIFINLYSFKEGRLWAHKSSLPTRNNLYGTQYQTIVNIPFNKAQGSPQTYESISYESNQLMITSVDGIKTSLGQISELIDEDFLKDVLDDGINQVNIYDSEGIYSAGFMKDKNVDIINGDNLKGTWVTVELITTDNSALKLKNVLVNSIASKIGAR